MKVLLNDGMDDEGIELFHKEGIKTDIIHRDLEELIRDIGNFNALAVRSKTKVSKEVIEAGCKGSLEVIGRAGVGYDNIDIESASKNGIVVKVAPNGNTNSTAEHVLALMFSCARKIPQAYSSLKNGVWKKKEFQGVELSNKTLGIIGCGRIGQRLSELARGCDMDVIGYDAYLSSVQRNFPDSTIKYMPKKDVLENSDFVSVNTGGKEIVIGKEDLQVMKNSAYLINASRGGNVSEGDLYLGLTNGWIAGAGFDAHENEPKKEGEAFEKDLTKLENFIMTPHLGASTYEAQKKTSLEMARAIIDYLAGRENIFENAVNVGETIESEEKKVYPVRIYHKDLPGAFGEIDKIFGDYGINIRRSDSRGIGENNAIATYLVHQKPSEEVKSSIEKLKCVYRIKG